MRALVHQGRVFVCAVQMLTRLPTPNLSGFQPEWLAQSVRYFPLVGQIVGVMAAAVWLGASQVWPGLPAAVLAVGAGALLTGGFHEDGLADTADGLGGGRDRAHKLEIMKDSRIGGYGVLALGLITLLRIAALARCGPWAGAAALVLAHGGARAAAVAVMAMLPYVREPSAAKLPPVGAGARWTDAVVALALGGWPLALFPAWRAVLAVGLAACVAAGVAWLARRLIDGITGDVLGAIEQVAEAALLLAAAAG